MDSRKQRASKRQIGSIFVERGHISEAQLALALKEQQATGEKLGEILVANYGVSRLDLADALAEQWAEDETGKPPNHLNGFPPAGVDADHGSSTVSGPPADLQAVLSQLGEAVALGAALKRTTDDLDSRLAAVETLLAALTGAIEELREATPTKPNNTTQETAPATPPAAREARATTTNDLLRQLTRGPRTVSELQESLGNLNERMLHRALTSGLVSAKATTLDRTAAKTDGEYYLTPAGASQIGEDPDQHPWPFRT